MIDLDLGRVGVLCTIEARLPLKSIRRRDSWSGPVLWKRTPIRVENKERGGSNRLVVLVIFVQNSRWAKQRG